MDLSNILGKGSGKSGASDSNDRFKVIADSGTDSPIAILWVGVAISVLASGFLFYLDFGLKNKVATKKLDRDTVTTKLDSSDYRKIKEDASILQIKIAQVQAALARRYSMANFMPEIFNRINSNVTLTSISLTNDGKFTMTGKTDSYRGAADQVMSFTDWKVEDKAIMDNIELGSIAISASKDNKGNVPVSITATIPEVPSADEKGMQ